MQDHDGLPGDCTMCEDETATIGTHTMLEVLPVAQGMDCLILTDLEGWQKLSLLTSSLLPSYASPPLLSLPPLSLPLASCDVTIFFTSCDVTAMSQAVM